jgi:hypothetical protein
MLKFEEIPHMLEHVPRLWRAFTATAIYAGLSKGGTCGLRKSDADHACRRCKSRGTPHVERHADAELRRAEDSPTENSLFQSEPPGDRTQDPRLKRPVLYQLS